MANQGTNQIAGQPVAIGAGLDCRQLTADRVPDLLILHENQRTQYASHSRQKFLAQMLEWGTFEQEVRQTFRHMVTQHGFVNDVMIFNQPDRYTNEQVMCGNEIGVVGRFQQHVGHVMTMVLQHMRSAVGNKSLRFGDWRNPGGPSFYPDLSIYNDIGEHFPAHLLAVGEAKTPWTMDIENARNLYVTQPTPAAKSNWERIVGQVANYMKVHGKQFGFLTTYEDTVFFKQAPAPSGNGTVLYFSRAISNDASSHPVAPPQLPGNVSLRECMLFIAYASSQNSDYVNHEIIWTEDVSSKDKSAASGFRDGRTGGGQGGGKSSGGPSSSGAKKRSGQSGQMRQLQDLQQLTQTVAPIGVKWSDDDKTFYYKNANEAPRRVDGYKFFGDKLEVKINGINTPLRAIIR